MRSKRKARIGLVVLSAILVIVAIVLALFLLFANRFSGGEFITFIVAFLIVALIISYGPEIQEISIAGNVVKLREIRADAEEAIESLKVTRTEMLGLFLKSAMKVAGGFSSGAMVNARHADFWQVIDLMRQYDAIAAHSSLIARYAAVLATSQLNNIKNSHRSFGDVDPQSLPPPTDVTLLALDPLGIDVAAKATNTDPASLTRSLQEGVSEYRRLIELIAEMKRFTNSSSQG